jgi:threonylcarbamoyladenosine tRNA methylthiotransferase MtaB
MPTFRVQVLGCKVNQYEALEMAQLLRDRGWQQRQQGAADVVIVHTCSVTTASAGKSRQLVRKECGRGAQATIVSGCWARGSEAEARQLTGAVITGERERLREQILQLASEIEARGASDGGATAGGACPAATLRRQPNQRALLKVQDGCDAWCSYCIVPRLRPALWSKSMDDAVSEARQLVAAGHLEIVLTGVFLGAYGQPTALRRRQGAPGALPVLVRRLCEEVRGLRRLRLSSLEPGDLTEELLETLAAYPQPVPHFHLPMQSGSEAVLRRMNRQYSRGEFVQTVARLRERFDRPALTTDIICGFPGETEADFEATCDAVRECGFVQVHAFPFSPRAGTAAARWREALVPQRVAGERVRQVMQLAEEQSLTYRRCFIGEEVEVLVEAGRGVQGRCERYFEVELSERRPVGALVRARVEAVERGRTLGRPVGGE